MARPSILLLCADMVGATHLGCYGDPTQLTPNIDRLADNGIRFNQAYCACPPCIPARVSMMCGQYAHTHGKTAHVKMALTPRPPLIPEILSAHGYRTGLVGKTHWWPPSDTLGCDEAHLTIDNHLTPELGENDAYIRFLRERGIYDYNASTWAQDRHRLNPDNLPPDCLKVNWTGDTACALLNRFSDSERPFFLACSFVEPHGTGSVQKSFLETFRDIPLRPIIAREGEHENKPETQRQAVARWEKQFANINKDERRRGVYASLNLVDANIGKILDTLERSGQRENIAVIFLTDHGDLLFDHGCIEKTFLYESAIRIPFVVSGPGIPGGETRDHLVSQIDLLPTVLDLCGVDQEDPKVEGRSLLPIIKAPQASWREQLFCEVEQTVHLRDLVVSSAAKMVRSGPWKYIYTLIDGHRIEEELYHLEDDPDELFNLAQDADQRARVAQLRSDILRWLVATEPNRLHPVPENHYPVPRVDRRYL